MRRQVPLIITGVVGVTLIISFFIPHTPFNRLETLFTHWYQIVAAFAIILGILNLLRINLDKLYKKQKDWFFGLVVVLSFLLAVIPGFFFSGGRSFQNPGTPFFWIYFYVYVPLMSTMFALLAFFVASASYRAFRARNKEATMLLLAAFFVMLGRVPIGYYLSSWLPENYQLSAIANWIMDFPQTAGQRAIMIGIALGIVSNSLRVILGLERAYIGGE
ncbi:MAG: hypothetical protein ACE5KJ_03935 [Candidatus Zixiibacteriota bacterium]